MSSSSPRNVAVIGAGITGLAAAFRLTQRGHRVRLFEASGRVGGTIRSESIDGWLIEAGPNSLRIADAATRALIDELGLRDAIVRTAAHAQNRYIVRRGRPVAAPLKPPQFIGSPLLSLGAKLRLLGEMWSSRRVRTADLSLEDFVRAHVGQEAVDYLLNPFVAGVYAGNPRKLSARFAFPELWEAEQKHGSLLRAQRAAARARKLAGQPAPEIVSFAAGLQTLPDTLAARLPAGVLARHARVETLVPGTPWNVVWTDGTRTQTETFDRVIAALPAPGLAQLRFGTLGERPLASLDAIEHPPVASLFLGYRRADVAHPLDGFGMLVPEIERRGILGVLFSSSLFSGRAPADHVALTVLVGGSRQPELARLPADQLLAAVAPDLRALLGVHGTPVFQRHHFWPRAIPQYALGHEVHLDTMATAERVHRGFLVGGQARNGISVPACIAAGERLAAQAEK